MLDEEISTESLLTTMEADFYEFRISNDAKDEKQGNNKSSAKSSSSSLPPLESVKE